MPEKTHYAISGGVQGRERLRVLARVMHPYSSALLDRVGLRDGMACLDVGCGGGDVTLEIARRIAPKGRAIGVDMDEAKIALAREEARQAGVSNVEFRCADAREASGLGEADVVYARFLLTHLSDPSGTVSGFQQLLRPGGRIAVEDIDFSGNFIQPASAAFERFDELYCAVVRRRGGDPNFGSRLPGILRSTGFEEIGVSVVQPVGLEGEVKLVSPLTLENIADAVLQEGLSTREEIDSIVAELHRIAEDRETLAGLPRIVQAWGRRPAG